MATVTAAHRTCLGLSWAVGRLLRKCLTSGKFSPCRPKKSQNSICEITQNPSLNRRSPINMITTNRQTHLHLKIIHGTALGPEKTDQKSKNSKFQTILRESLGDFLSLPQVQGTPRSESGPTGGGCNILMSRKRLRQENREQTVFARLFARETLLSFFKPAF